MAANREAVRDVLRTATGPLNANGERVTVKTARGNLYIGPNGEIDGLWRLVQRELRTNPQVREMCGCSRPTLLRWRARAVDPFPQPVVLLKEPNGTLELWERTAVEAWLARETR